MSAVAVATPVEALLGSPELVAYAGYFIDPDPTINLANELTVELAPLITPERRRAFGGRVIRNMVGHAYDAAACVVFGAGAGLLLEVLRTSDKMHGEITVGALATTFLMRFLLQSARQRVRR